MSEIRGSEIRGSEIRGSEIRVSEIRVSEIRISSNHHELHGAIFFICSFGSKKMWTMLLPLWHEKQQKHIQLLQLVTDITSKNTKIDKHIHFEKQCSQKHPQISSKSQWTWWSVPQWEPIWVQLWHDLDGQMAQQFKQWNKWGVGERLQECQVC